MRLSSFMLWLQTAATGGGGKRTAMKWGEADDSSDDEDDDLSLAERRIKRQRAGAI